MGFLHMVLFGLLMFVARVRTDDGCWSAWRRYGLTCYGRHNYNFNHNAAASNCAYHSRTFGVSRTREEKEFLRHFVVDLGYDVWMGLKRINGNWTWHDGTPYTMDEDDWVPGEPPADGGDLCAYASRCTAGKYKATQCSSTRPFLCSLEGRHGGWSQWSSWGACSKACGTGRQSRTRSCNTPATVAPGSACFGRSDEYRTCNTQYCTAGWGVCTAWGDPHYMTFDRQRYSFMGGDKSDRECKFLLAATCKNSALPQFKILGTNDHRGQPSVSVLKTVQLHFRGHVIKMDHYVRSAGQIWVDGMRVSAGNYRGIMGLTVSRIYPHSVRLSINDGVVYVQFDGRQSAKIGVDTCLQGAHNGLCGMCGNYDGNAANDMYLRDGTVNTNANIMGWSYQEPGKDGQMCPTDHTTPCLEKTCDLKSECSVLSGTYTFGSCASALPRHDQCAIDMCCSNEKPDRCEMFRDYVETCAGIGYTVPSTWEARAVCVPPTCPKNSTYLRGASSCQETCTGPVDGCKNVHVSGTCVCDEGYVWHGTECIRADACGCVGDNGEVHAVDSSWVDECCHSEFKCILDGNGNAVINSTQHECHQYSSCQKIDGRYGCQCSPGHHGDGYNCSEFQCPSNKDALYVDPESCTHYYRCHQGNASHHQCSSVLRYNRTMQGCLLDTGCHDSCKQSKANGPRLLTKRGVTDFQCPAENGFFPVNGSCTKFHACAEGIPTKGECHHEYIFSQSRGICVPPDEEPCAYKETTAIPAASAPTEDNKLQL